MDGWYAAEVSSILSSSGFAGGDSEVKYPPIDLYPASTVAELWQSYTCDSLIDLIG